VITAFSAAGSVAGLLSGFGVDWDGACGFDGGSTLGLRESAGLGAGSVFGVPVVVFGAGLTGFWAARG